MGAVGRNLVVCVLTLALVCDSTHPVNGASRHSADGTTKTAKHVTSNNRRVQPESGSGSVVAAFWAAHRAPPKASPKRLIRSEKLLGSPATVIQSEELVGRPAIVAEINAGGSTGAHVGHGPKFANDRRTRIIERTTQSSFLGMESEVDEDIEIINLPGPEGAVEGDGDTLAELAPAGKKVKVKPKAPGQGEDGPAGPPGEMGDPGKATEVTEDLPALIEFKLGVVKKKDIIEIMACQVVLGLIIFLYFSGAVSTMKSTIMKKKLAEAAAKAEEAEAPEVEAEGEGEGGGEAEDEPPP